MTSQDANAPWMRCLAHFDYRAPGKVRPSWRYSQRRVPSDRGKVHSVLDQRAVTWTYDVKTALTKWIGHSATHPRMTPIPFRRARCQHRGDFCRGHAAGKPIGTGAVRHGFLAIGQGIPSGANAQIRVLAMVVVVTVAWAFDGTPCSDSWTTRDVDVVQQNIVTGYTAVRKTIGQFL